ncbi:MAG: OsmC family protein [Acetobacteraceae bacterium]|nr:OsmC family protein [Pseudomonadota bacterium]
MSATTMTIEVPRQKRVPVPLNGINTPGLFATIDVVRNQPQLGNFQFRAKGEWLGGTHMKTTMADFSGAGGEHSHKAAFTATADHPTVLCGADNAPTPVEYLLHALAACVTAGTANIAAARGVTLHAVTSSVEGDMDLRGILGLSDQVRNGFSAIRLRIFIKGDATPDKLRQIVQQACDRSAVLDVLRNGVSVNVEATG